MLSVFKNNQSERFSNILLLNEDHDAENIQTVTMSQTSTVSNDRMNFIESSLVQISESLKLFTYLSLNNISSQSLLKESTKTDISAKSTQLDDNSNHSKSSSSFDDFGVMKTQIKIYLIENNGKNIIFLLSTLF